MSQGQAQYAAAWRSLPLLGKVAVALCALVIALALIPAWRLAASIVGPRPKVPEQRKAGEEAQRVEQFERYIAQIDGRSLFHTPAAPGADSAPKVEVDASKPPPPPSTYGGPAVIGMVNDEVWFADGKRLRIGAEARDGIAVVSANAPWEATISWRGVEFKVPLFSREHIVFKDTKAAAPSPAVPPVPPASGEPPPTAPDPGSSPAPDEPRKADEPVQTTRPGGNELAREGASR